MYLISVSLPMCVPLHLVLLADVSFILLLETSSSMTTFYDFCLIEFTEAHTFYSHDFSL